jgi:SPP1 gp7 family putative phage head morphogenesis protein
MQDKDYVELEKSINELLWDLVYGPIVKLAKSVVHEDSDEELPELENAPASALRKALQSGKVQMTEDQENQRAVFTVAGAPGKDVASALREFASFNKTIGAYTCPIASVPAWVRTLGRSYGSKARDAHAKMLRLLADLDKEVDAKIESRSLQSGTRHAVKSAHDSWKDAAKTLQVGLDLDAKGLASLSESMEKVAKIPIKDWAHEAIDRLRGEVEENVERGYRAEGLAKRIRSEYGASKARANLIAVQETSNIMAGLRKARAKDAGLRRYVWMCSMDGREREDHRKLHGTTQDYDKPPIVDSRTGRRGNPGEDFRCRCIDMPVVE